MITIATLFWEANRNSLAFSRMYSTEWVEKLYRGIERNLTTPFEFVVYTDRIREYSEPVTQVLLKAKTPDYSSCVQPFELGRPTIMMGLDTIITGNIDHLAAYTLSAPKMALPRNPYKKYDCCNGVCLIPDGYAKVWAEWDGANDMSHVARYDYEFIDDMWPGHVVSYKVDVKANGLGDARIVYFHGEEKPHQLANIDWIKANWR